MDYKGLVCNYKDCYKELKELAFVTVCSHIFCVDHGNKLKSSLENGCLACKTVLLDHQVIETNLTTSLNSKMLLLFGLDPNSILKVAMSALSFWNYQKRNEYEQMKRELEHKRFKLQNQAKLTDEKELRIKGLLLDVEKLTNEKQLLKTELMSKNEELTAKKPRNDY